MVRVRLKLAARLYALAVVLLPLSYAVKDMLSIVDIPWIDPSLILGLLVFFLLGSPMKDKRALALVCWTFLSAGTGYFFLAVSPERNKSALYVMYVEPVRLGLTVVWFWISIEFWSARRDFVVRWLAISVLLQFLLAAYLSLALLDLAPVPQSVAVYLSIYRGRQSVWFGDTEVYRMAGTFIESPPFGLFMFSSLVIFGLWLAVPQAAASRNRNWAAWGAGVGFAGAAASLSDQIFLAVIAFLPACYLAGRKSIPGKTRAYGYGEALCAVALLAAMSAYTIPRAREKWQEALSAKPTDTDVAGLGGGERAFHLRYGLQRLEEVPLAVWTGIGPGRYGDYAVRTRLFPATVTLQNMPLSWLVEYGLFGTGLICLWLWKIARVAQKNYGGVASAAFVGLLIASASQGVWYSESWFLALAFLCTSPRETAAEP
jgi:hypothetical protein